MKLTRDEFKALQKHWYQKAKDAGFKDAEILHRDELELKQSSQDLLKGQTTILIAARDEYYTRMVHKAFDAATIFKNLTDRHILMRHAEGAKICQIVRELQCLGMNRDRRNVRLIIRRYEEKWKIKHYKKR